MSSINCTGTGSYTVTGSGSLVCSGSFNVNAAIDLNGVDSYLNFPDSAGWGDYGSLDNPITPYSFGFVLGDDWKGGSFEEFSALSRGERNGVAIADTTSINVQDFAWVGSDGTPSSGSNGFDNDKADSFKAGDALQFNFSAPDGLTYVCDVYYNGIKAENGDGFSMASWATKPTSTGVVRFGFPVPQSSGSWSYWDGKIKALWFANGHTFTDGQVSLDQSTNPDITGQSYYNTFITSFFNLGNDTYPNIVDLKGNVTTGSLVNGDPADFITS